MSDSQENVVTSTPEAAAPTEQVLQTTESEPSQSPGMAELEAEALAYSGSEGEVKTEEATTEKSEEIPSKEEEEFTKKEEEPAAKEEKTEAQKDQEDADNPEDEKPNKFWRPEDQKKFEKAIRQKVKYREQAEALTKDNAEKTQYQEILAEMATTVSKNGLPVDSMPRIVELTSKALGGGDAESMDRLGQELIKKGWNPNIQTGQSEKDISEAIQAALDEYAINGEVKTAKEKAEALLASRRPKKSEAPSAEQRQTEDAKRYEEATGAANNEIVSFIKETTKSMREEDKTAFIKKVDAALLGKINKARPETWATAVMVAADFIKSQMAKPDAKTPPKAVQGNATPQRTNHKPGSPEALEAEFMASQV